MTHVLKFGREAPVTDGRSEKTEDGGQRQADADALLKQAMERPGIREVMRVYEDWKRADEAMEPYRAAMRPVGTVTNRTNASEGT